MTNEPSLDQDLDYLSNIDAFQRLLETWQARLNGLLDEMEDVSADKLQLHMGRIVTYRDILSDFNPGKHGV